MPGVSKGRSFHRQARLLEEGPFQARCYRRSVCFPMCTRYPCRKLWAPRLTRLLLLAASFVNCEHVSQACPAHDRSTEGINLTRMPRKDAQITVNSQVHAISWYRFLRKLLEDWEGARQKMLQNDVEESKKFQANGNMCHFFWAIFDDTKDIALKQSKARILQWVADPAF